MISPCWANPYASSRILGWGRGVRPRSHIVPRASILPLRDENLRFPPRPRRGPHQLLAIGGEHRQPVETVVERDPLEADAVVLHQGQIENSGIFIFYSFRITRDN